MNLYNYSPPLDQLLIYGNPGELKEWPNYVEEFGLTAEHIPDLIRMATDRKLNLADANSLEVWAPLHGWRALGQLRANAAIKPLIQLSYSQPEVDEWLTSELPKVFALIGPAAIPDLAAYLANPWRTIYQRATAADALEEIGIAHSEVRKDCVQILTEELGKFADNHPTLNGMVIANLIGLKAVESAVQIEQAFIAERVDPFINGEWEEVQVELGLKPCEEVSEKRFNLTEMFEYMEKFESEEVSRGFGKNPGKNQKKASQKKKRK